jgi:hypothetical protein
MTLCFWYDIEPSEINTRQAQLALAMRRMAFVSEELKSVRDLERWESVTVWRFKPLDPSHRPTDLAHWGGPE